MSAHFGYGPERPLKVVGMEPTLSHTDTQTEAPDSGPLPMSEEPYIVDGLDLNDVKQAGEWLSKIHKEIGEGFEAPLNPRKFDEIAGIDIAYAWANVLRAAINENGREQSDAEHSAVSAQMAMEILPRFGYSDATVGWVVMVLMQHDRVEAPANDTGVFEENPLIVATKHPREHAGRTILKDRDRDNPLLSRINLWLEGNFSQENEEDLPWIKEVMDLADGIEKLEPTTHALYNKCSTQKTRGDDIYTFIDKAIDKASSHPITRHLAIQASKYIAQKWQSKWGCKPHEYIDTDALVDKIAAEQLARQEPIDSPKATLYKFPHKVLNNAEVILDPTKGPLVAPKAGKLVLMSSVRSRHNKPFSPDPIAA